MLGTRVRDNYKRLGDQGYEIGLGTRVKVGEIDRMLNHFFIVSPCTALYNFETYQKIGL